jgi:PAS domain S-box-containing protein
MSDNQSDQADREGKQTNGLHVDLCQICPLGIVAAEISTGIIAFANPSACGMFGYDEGEFARMRFCDLHPPESRDHATDMFMKQARGELRTAELPCVRKDGTVFYAEISAGRARTRMAGDDCNVGFFRDITERRQAEAALRTSEQLVYIAKDASRLGIHDYDVITGTIRWDQRMRELWGIGPGAPIDHDTFMSRLHPDDRAKTQAALDRALDPAGDGEYHTHYRVIRRSDGIERWLAATGQVFFEHGRALRLVGTVQDITDLKECERNLHELIAECAESNVEIARSNAELQQFAYVASHDLQEPLRMISSYVQLLSRRYEGKLDEDADQFIAYAVEGTKRMHRLIEDLLAYSRVGARGKQFQPTDCSTVCRQAIANLQAAITESEATVTCDSLPTVWGDDTQITQLLQNLIGNAIKFRREEPPLVRVSAESSSDEWVFAVSDNGIGIAPEHRERIFEIFERLHTESQYGGTGLGLAVCKKIVEVHGGRIWVESEPGRGSTFFFTIPERRHEANR